MAKINDYIYTFLSDFKNNYKLLREDVYSIQNKYGLSDMHYNSYSPESDLIYPCNRISDFVPDEENCVENTFKGVPLYEKETQSAKFFNIVNQNPLLNLLYPERDNMRYDFPEPPDNMKEFCKQYDALTTFMYSSMKPHKSIRAEYRHIVLLIYDNGPGPLAVTSNGLTVELQTNFDSFYFLHDSSCEIINPYYEKNFVFLGVFEFENYAEFTSLNTLNSIPGF
jgi:hypothetical protein